MSEAAVATPATETAAAPAPGSLEESIDAIAAAAGEDLGLSKPGPASKTDAAAPAEGDKTDPAAKDGDKTPAAPAWDATKDFTDEELSTPEGVQACADKVRGGLKDLRQRTVQLDGRYAKFKQKEARQAETFRRWEQEREQNTVATRQIFAAVQAAQNGDAESRLRALGTLMGMDPIAALEHLNLGIATDGKGHAKSPGEEALIKRLDEMEQRWAQREEQFAQQQRIAALSQQATELNQRISPEKYPVLAKFHELNAEETLRDLLNSVVSFQERTGQRIDYDQFLRFTEDQLAQKFGFVASAGNGTPTPTSTAQSSPAESISPSISSRGGSVRGKTADEMRAEAEELVPSAWLRMSTGM